MIDWGKIGNSWWDRTNGGRVTNYNPEKVSPNRPPSGATATTQGGEATANTTIQEPSGATTMNGGFTNYPSQWQTASNTYTDIANANPQSWGDWYNKAKQTAQYDITDAIRQAVETAGMGGMRWSDTLGRTGQDIAARTMAGLGAQYAQNEMGGYLANQQNRLGAAGGLSGLGQQYAYLPMDVANNMMNLGNTMQNAYNQQISPYYGLWNQLQPYNSPWLNLNMQNAQSYQPQQYQQSFLSQLLGGASSALPFLFL